MNKAVILFAGTTEGRKMAEYYAGKAVDLHVCVTTDYAQTLLAQGNNIQAHIGRMPQETMEALMRDTGASLVIDATHPYAAEATKTIRAACESTGTEYLRLLRAKGTLPENGVTVVPDTQAAVDYLNTVEGSVLLTVGSKELRRYTAVNDYQNRLFARVLPLKSVLEDTAAYGFEGKNLICMQGPFSKELNIAMLRSTGAKYMVTKDTGDAGGFEEKLEAAREAGVQVVVVARPLDETGLGLAQCKVYVDEKLGFASNKQVTVLGIGTGNSGTLTMQAHDACAQAELLIGAPRILESLSEFGKPGKAAIAPEDILTIIESTDAERIVVAMSGDVGFYSGTKKLLPLLEPFHPIILPGISSIMYFCSRLQISWEDSLLCSVHGRSCNYIAKMRRSAKTLSLVGGKDGVHKLLSELVEYGLSHVTVSVGENLSYENERITTGHPAELLEQTFTSLAVVYVCNPAPVHRGTGWPDDAFLRAEVPMTKSEVRAVTLSKLGLQPNSVCYDIGAGTGSVSLEMATAAEDGQVYAIECNPDACELIERNKRHLGVTNVEVVPGMAPDAITELPAPTHTFLGGTKGNLREILHVVLQKNPRVRIVINTVTAESFAETVSALKAAPVHGLEIVQLSVSRGRKVGGYHLMTAQNPVYLISCTGGTDNENT